MSKKEAENACFWLSNQSTSKMDVLTPHKMVVVFLIQEYMRLKKSPDSGTTEEQPPAIELSYADRKRFCMLLLKLIQYPDMPYKDLHGLLVSPTYGLHPVHLEEFTKLMKLLKSVGIDVLFDLYNDIDKLIMDNSVLIGIVGLHLRKVFVTMDKMNFQEVMELYQATIAYYDKGMEAMEAEKHEASEIEASLQHSQYKPIEPCDHGTFAAKWSVKQSELFVAQQTALLKENEVKALPPNELQERLDEIIHDRPQYSQAYFLQYLNNLRVRDVNNAIQALHRSFDRGTTASSAAVANGGSSVPAASESYTKEYQYCNLNLAILHSHFGHQQHALKSLQECITLAHDNGDLTCLHLAQSWIARLNNHDTPIPEKNSSISAIHATSLGVLAGLQSSCRAGDAVPSKLFGLLMLNDHLNCQRSMMDLVANGTAVRAALWTVYGKHEMASLCAQILMNADLKSLDKIYNGEGICQVICTIAVRLAFLGEFNLAIVMVKHAKDRFPRYPHTIAWSVTDHYITLTRAIYRGHWAEAIGECQKLHSFDKPLALLQFAHVMLAKLDITTAKTIILRLLKNSDALEPLIHVRALILYANTFMPAHHAGALSELGKAQDLARKYYLEYEDAIIDLHIGYIYLVHMHVPRQALVPLKSCLETILANGPIYDKSRAIFTFARALVEAEEKQNRLEKLVTLMPMLEEAMENFEKLECYSKAKDMYIYLAKTFHSLGQHDEQNRFAYRYRVLQEQFPTELQYLNIFH
ncbi:AGAP005578-PA-like protein [Anopheles sinensis]|uniref:Anaphase-promoting complex subunit 5 n=1 Tax=Anopheles sinensis TaxID=74873 RepID=A0A084WKN8_ANOSI|nr:AGAP005578-PA-like protein [Anopheles sinensis]